MRCKVVLRRDLDTELISIIESRPEKPIRALAIFDLLRRGMSLPFSPADPNLLHIESSNPEAYILTFSCHDGSDIAQRWLSSPMRARSTYFRSLMKNGFASLTPAQQLAMPPRPVAPPDLPVRPERREATQPAPGVISNRENLTPPDPPAAVKPVIKLASDPSPTELDPVDHDAPVVLRSLR